MDEFLDYRVADAMTHRPLTVGPKSTVASVEALFAEHGQYCLPVCDRDGRLLGVVTKLDVLCAFASTPDTMGPRYEKIMRRPAESVMTRGAVSVSPDTPLTRVLDLMLVTRSTSLPVTMGRLLLGVITHGDVLRAARRAAGVPALRIPEEDAHGRRDLHPSGGEAAGLRRDPSGSGHLRGLGRVA